MYGVHVNVFADHKSLQYMFTKKKLNLQQKRQLQLLKDYNITVLYHHSKANVFGDALILMSINSVHAPDDMKELVKEVHRLALLGVLLEDSQKKGLWFIIIPNYFQW